MSLLMDQHVASQAARARLGVPASPVRRVALPARLRDRPVQPGEVMALGAALERTTEELAVALDRLAALELRLEVLEAAPGRAQTDANAAPGRTSAPTRGQRTTAARILAEVCAATGISLAHLKSTRRRRALVEARQWAMYRLTEETPLSLPAIGRLLGGRDHTTVIYGARKHAARMAAGQGEGDGA